MIFNQKIEYKWYYIRLVLTSFFFEVSPGLTLKWVSDTHVDYFFLCYVEFWSNTYHTIFKINIVCIQVAFDRVHIIYPTSAFLCMFSLDAYCPDWKRSIGKWIWLRATCRLNRGPTNIAGWKNRAQNSGQKSETGVWILLTTNRNAMLGR